ncbi:MAG TPA: hypothetical protein PLR76_08540 [Hyphomonas sp.]|nr:hypothetical protein [Hyphomonas sp.]HPE48430.1 hypothetical protein [Hyphomonas sp.]
MSERPEARPSGRDLLARQEASENFELARHGGSWMVVTGFLAAFLWIGGVVAVALGYFGVPALQAMNPWLLAGAGMAALIPAVLIVMAGYMGRTNRRASASNALVMEAAVRLMAPAREAGTEGITFAEQMKQSAAEVDKAMSHALTAMKAMSGEIGDERHRLEQVAYASADNARDLTQRLAAERQALEGLARELRVQLQQMNEAIPRQAQMMVEIARQAGDEVARADDALEARLSTMQSASSALAGKLVDLDNLARDAAARTEALTFAIARIEEKLDQSRRTVDAAVRAGEIAAAAAMTTGDALKEAVATAIDGARAASHEITESSRSVADEAARSLARLRQAGQEATAALRDTEIAARDEVARMERSAAYEPRPAPAPAPVRPAPAPAASPPRPAAPPPVRSQGNGHSNGNANGNGHANGYPGREASSAPPAAPAPAPRRPEPRARPLPDDDLFDAAADLIASASLGDVQQRPPEESPLELGRSVDPMDPNPLTLRRRFDDVKDEPVAPSHPMRRKTDFPEVRAPAAAQPAAVPEPPAPPPTVVPPAGVQARPAADANGSEIAWRDIISDMSREEGLPQDREGIADRMIQRLQSSGIQLPEAFRPRAKRKIAEAARKGEKQRKAATIEQAGRQVERVTQRLRNDDTLLELARYFLEMEQDDALNALEQTQKTSRNASPRLAAYLLIDAAL